MRDKLFINKDDTSPSLAIRLTTRAMRLLFFLKMFQYTFLEFELLFVLPNGSAKLIAYVVYSIFVSAWGFLVWAERGYRNNLQPSRCTKIKCSCCNSRKKHPRWFKYKNWMYFLLLYLSLVLVNFMIQLFFTGIKMVRQGIDIISRRHGKNVTCEEISSFIWQFHIGAVLIHFMTSRLFKNYYLHNGPFEADDRSITNEKEISE
ncbi:SKDZ16G3305 [Saccharomyces kudriavzevii ZP591]|nr:SKDZ16G3305 [Saccharomyces kudriavzevii ZP591]